MSDKAVDEQLALMARSGFMTHVAELAPPVTAEAMARFRAEVAGQARNVCAISSGRVALCLGGGIRELTTTVPHRLWRIGGLAARDAARTGGVAKADGTDIALRTDAPSGTDTAVGSAPATAGREPPAKPTHAGPHSEVGAAIPGHSNQMSAAPDWAEHTARSLNALTEGQVQLAQAIDRLTCAAEAADRRAAARSNGHEAGMAEIEAGLRSALGAHLTRVEAAGAEAHAGLEAHVAHLGTQLDTTLARAREDMARATADHVSGELEALEARVTSRLEMLSEGIAMLAEGATPPHHAEPQDVARAIARLADGAGPEHADALTRLASGMDIVREALAHLSDPTANGQRSVTDGTGRLIETQGADVRRGERRRSDEVGGQPKRPGAPERDRGTDKNTACATHGTRRSMHGRRDDEPMQDSRGERSFGSRDTEAELGTAGARADRRGVHLNRSAKREVSAPVTFLRPVPSQGEPGARRTETEGTGRVQTSGAANRQADPAPLEAAFEHLFARLEDPAKRRPDLASGDAGPRGLTAPEAAPRGHRS